MNIRIIKAGVMDTIQDLGRYGWQHLGINTGGAMDKLSATVANFLAGNESNEPVVELHYPAASFFFEQPALIALAGGDFTASINGDEIPLLHPILVSKYSILQFHSVLKGARIYMAVNGGLKTDAWLGSFSTHLKAGLGGYKGRSLQKDDEIRIESAPALCSLIAKKEFIVLPWKADTAWEHLQTEQVFVLPGKEFPVLSPGSKQQLVSQDFAITGQSDRMGYQLKAAPLATDVNCELVSSPVSFGTLQLLPDGQLILLMADHQTTGGYPRIGHVITAHHHKLAQAKPGDVLRFGLTDLATAEALLLKQQQHLLQLQNACKFRLQEYLHAKH